MTETARPWWKGAVIYQIYPRSFQDTTGTGIGDLNGITERLGYIADLGVDAIWISPFFKSPMKDYGYDVADYRCVDPMFGSNDDFDRLIDRAHALGLKVMVDMVYAHTSNQHAWFIESRANRDNPKADWYVWADPQPDGTPPNNWLSVFGGPAWQWEPRRSQYYLHHFLVSQPNLNWHNPAVADAMFADTKFWLDKGVDGLRLDAISTLFSDAALRSNPPVDPADRVAEMAGAGNNPIAMQNHIYDRDQPEMLPMFNRLRKLVEQYPSGFLLGEIADVDSIAAVAKYTRGRDRLHSGYTFQLMQAQFDAGMLKALVGRLERELDDGWMTWSLSNHDSPRSVSRFGVLPHLSGDRAALAKLLMALQLSLRGSVCIYQGEELGLTEVDIPYERLLDPWGIEFWPDFKGRDGCRTPMAWSSHAVNCGFSIVEPWLPVGPDHGGLAVDVQNSDENSTLEAYRRFLAWRRSQAPIIDGDFLLRDDLDDPIFAFERSKDGQRMLCVFNLSNEPRDVAIEDGWHPSDGHGFGADLDGGKVTLPAFGAFFASSA